MKVCYITMQFPVPSEAFASVEIGEIQSRGHEVLVCSLRKKPSFADKVLSERHTNIPKTHYFSFKDFFALSKFLIFSPVLFFRLLIWILKNNIYQPLHLIKSLVLLPSVISSFYKVKKFQPDVVHLFWGHYPVLVGFLLREMYPLLKITMFIGAHDLRVNYNGSKVFSKVANQCFTHNKANLSLINNNGLDASLFEVVYRGIKVNPLLESYEKPNFNDGVIFLSAGRVVKEKGVFETLEIFRKYNIKNSRSKLYIAGDGDAVEELRKEISKNNLNGNVFLVGHLSQEELFQYMRESHFFITMSYVDHLPNVVKEAMLHKCVPISSNTTGIEELVEHEVNGFIVPSYHYDIAVEHIDLLVCDQDKYTLFTEKGYSAVCSKFNVKCSVDAYFEYWKR